MKLNGSEILINVLLEQEVDTVFGYPGGAILNIHDALYKYQDEINHILTSHEQGACHAADGYARVTGKPGVVIATSGPGATNIVTGIANAYMDSIPLVAITGNVAKSLLGRDSFQEIDIAGVTMPITKNNYIINDVSEIADAVREAFEIAISGRPGPVLIDIAKDATAEMCEYTKKEKVVKRAIPVSKDNKYDIALDMIKEAKQPLIYAGGGVTFSIASCQLFEFAEKIDCPVSTSMMGLTSIPYDHKLNLGMIGMHGTPVSNKASVECDLIIAIGTRFDDRVAGNRKSFAKNAKIIHIDIDRSEHNKNVMVDLTICGDAKDVLEMLTEKLDAKKHTQWVDYLNDYKKSNPLPVIDRKDSVSICDILEEIHKNVSEDAIIVTDVGQHQMFTAQHYKFKKPRTFVSSCGLGTMGFGLGAAIGAKAGKPNSEVILITGDGSFHMNLNELACVVSEKMDIKVFIINNNVLGMVRQWQRMFYKGRYSNTNIARKTDFLKLAEAFGANGYRIEKPDEITDTVKTVIKDLNPCICECVIHEDDSVFPIIPPGGSAEDIIIKEEI
ncbi:MAG: biosynthetic-type acetolactate synthase large subunit [Clostridia bacterium]